MHGELFGVIMALRQARLQGTNMFTIHSDYLNIVQRIHRHETDGTGMGNFQNGKAWLKWILNLWDELLETGVNITIQHVKAHTEITPESTEDRILNQKADETARVARTPPTTPHWAPWPTFEMETYTAWKENIGYIEQDLYKWTKTYRLQQRARKVASRYPGRFSLILYENAASSNREYYLKSPRDYGIKVQALTRGHVLKTNLLIEKMYPRSQHGGPSCPHCGEIESEYHVFVKCVYYEQERNRCIEDCKEKIRNYLSRSDQEEFQSAIEAFIQQTFTDGPLWPGTRSQYYMVGYEPLIRATSVTNTREGKSPLLLDLFFFLIQANKKKNNSTDSSERGLITLHRLFVFRSSITIPNVFPETITNLL